MPMVERFHYPNDRETRNEARIRALESLLIEKGIITNDTVDKVLSFFETQMGPFNGAKVVARAWVDPAFKKRLIEDTPAVIAELDLPKGMAGAEGEHMRAVANSPTVHNLTSVPCARVIPGRSSAFPLTGTKTRLFGLVRRASRAPCSRNLGSI